MGKSVWGSTPKSQRAQGTLLNSYTTAKSILNGQAQLTLPADFWYVGKQMAIEVAGAVSNIVTTPGTIQFLLKLGTVASPITVWDGGALQLNASAHTTLPFWMTLLLRCDTEGSGTSAHLFGVAKIHGLPFCKTAGQVDSLQSDSAILLPQTAPAAGGGFDSTISNTLDLWAGFSISNAGNGVRVDHFLPVSWDV